MYAIPILFPTAEGHNNGSGFVVLAAGRHWLTTAAHLVHLIRQPHKNWQIWPQHVIVPGGEIPLFDMFKPRFAYLDAGTIIGDLLMLPLPEPLSGYTVFDLTAALAAVGDEVTAFGYVRLGSTLSHQQAIAGTILGHRDELVLTTIAMTEGFSGGPLVTHAGHLAGMNIGTEDGMGVAVSLNPLRRAISDFPAGA